MNFNNQIQIKLLFIENDQNAQQAFKKYMQSESLYIDYTIIDSINDLEDTIKKDRYNSIVISTKEDVNYIADKIKSIKNIPIILIIEPEYEKIISQQVQVTNYEYLVKDIHFNYLIHLPLVIQNLIMKQTLLLSWDKLNLILEKISVGIILTDNKQSIKLINNKARIIFGVDSYDSSLSFQDLLKNCEDKGQLLLNSLNDDKVNNFDLMVEHPFKRNLKVSKIPYQEKFKSATEYLFLCYDITPEIELDRMKSDFVSSVSHELRTPLASILGFSDTILRDKKMDDVTKIEFIDIIYQESKRLSHLIEDILCISNIESFQLDNKLKKVAVSSVLNEVIIIFQKHATRKGLQLISNINDNLPKIMGSEDTIEQIAVNLLENAIKFTESGGTITVNLDQEDDYIFFEVQDTGLGIPSKDQSNIFNKFFRVYRPNKEIQGTGLGLYIVRQIVNFYKGKIEVTSEEGNGSQFRVYFPILFKEYPEFEYKNSNNLSEVAS